MLSRFVSQEARVCSVCFYNAACALMESFVSTFVCIVGFDMAFSAIFSATLRLCGSVLSQN